MGSGSPKSCDALTLLSLGIPAIASEFAAELPIAMPLAALPARTDVASDKADACVDTASGAE